MQRSIAILLAMVFSTWFLVPAFAAPAAGSNLPACCRKAGKHHCAMQASESGMPGKSPVTISQKCPCLPSISLVAHAETLMPAAGQSIFAGIVRHPSVCPQTEAGYRVSHLRSRHKRGPPASLLS